MDDRRRQQMREASRRWKDKNAEYLRQYEYDRYWSDPEAAKQRAKKDPVKNRARTRRYALLNPSKRASWEALRRARTKQAMPQWLNLKHRQEIEEFYTVARELSWLSDGGLHVDHIVPLRGSIVSGLHVPWNLQIVPAADNLKKHNKLVA